MWDAFDGELRCSYRGYDAVDEVETALSATFSADGTQIIGGYRKSIKIFQTNVPGRKYTEIPIKAPASAIAVNNSSALAVGSWNGAISLYDTRYPEMDVIDQLVEHNGGVTFLKFLPENFLLSGARKDRKLLMWDLRAPSKPLMDFTRTVNTNQRIYFDISSDGQWLISGDTDGLVRAWNLKEDNIGEPLKVRSSTR